jgi:glycosyltransferase involved in cell wall biosynthesis
MVIVMLSHGYPPTVSGVTLVVQKLSKRMTGLGHRVVVITASERGEAYRDCDQGVELIRVSGIRNPVWSDGPIPYISTRELGAILTEVKPDLVHTHENAVMSAQLLRLKRKISAPLISSCYYLPGYVPHYLPFGRQINRLVEALIWKYTIWNLNQFDQVVFSTPTHQQMFARHGLSAPAIAISNGVNVERYFPLDGRFELELTPHPLPPRPRILFVSRLAKDKKIDVLIRAMAFLKPDCPANLILAGKGDDRPRLEELVRQLHLEDTVHFLGFIPEQDMPQIYRGADLFAIASICEVQSIPVLQAAATGLPIVAANAGALPELVHDGANGFLVPPDDPEALSKAIRRILNDGSFARQLGQASLEIARKHAEGATFQAYEALYEFMIQRHHGSPNSSRV